MTEAYFIPCMTCHMTAFIQEEKELVKRYGKSWLFEQVARKMDWVFTTAGYKIFICCSQCYPKCFGPGGNVGILKEEYRHLMIEAD